MSGGKADVVKLGDLMETITDVPLAAIQERGARNSPEKMVKLGLQEIEAADRNDG